MALSRVGEMGNKHKRGIKIVILTCFLIIVFFLLAYYFFQFIKRMKWDVISLKIIIRCIFLYIISLKYYYINFILGQFRISKKIHLKISFLSHNKEKKRSHSIFFSSYFRIPTTSLPSQDRNKRSYHSQQSEKKKKGILVKRIRI